MNTAQAIQRVMRHLAFQDLSEVPAESALDLVRELNASLGEFFDLAPAQYKQTTVSHDILEPVSITGIDIAPGTYTVSSGTPFTADQRGASFIFDDQRHQGPNEVVSPTTLLNAYSGSTTPASGKLYYDFIPIRDFDVERAVDDVRLLETGQVLYREQGFSPSLGRTGDYLERGYGFPSYYENNRTWGSQRCVGTYPASYAIDLVGGSSQDSGDAVFLIRLNPLPTKPCTVQLDLNLYAKVYTLNHLDAPEDLPVPDALADRLLVPLLESRLTSSILWKGDDRVTRKVETEGDRARAAIERLPAEFGTPLSTLGTRRGF